MAGRKPKLVGEALEQFIGALKGGADIAIAANIAGVSAQTARATMKRKKTVAQRVEDAKAIADDLVVRRLYEKALAGDTKAMIFWLKNRRARTWRDRHEIKHDGEVRNYTFATRRLPPRERDDDEDAGDDATAAVG